jgi:hypothetical protein
VLISLFHVRDDRQPGTHSRHRPQDCHLADGVLRRLIVRIRREQHLHGGLLHFNVGMPVIGGPMLTAGGYKGDTTRGDTVIAYALPR